MKSWPKETREKKPPSRTRASLARTDGPCHIFVTHPRLVRVPSRSQLAQTQGHQGAAAAEPERVRSASRLGRVWVGIARVGMLSMDPATTSNDVSLEDVCAFLEGLDDEEGELGSDMLPPGKKLRLDFGLAAPTQSESRRSPLDSSTMPPVSLFSSPLTRTAPCCDCCSGGRCQWPTTSTASSAVSLGLSPPAYPISASNR